MPSGGGGFGDCESGTPPSATDCDNACKFRTAELPVSFRLGFSAPGLRPEVVSLGTGQLAAVLVGLRMRPRARTEGGILEAMGSASCAPQVPQGKGD